MLLVMIKLIRPALLPLCLCWTLAMPCPRFVFRLADVSEQLVFAMLSFACLATANSWSCSRQAKAMPSLAYVEPTFAILAVGPALALVALSFSQAFGRLAA